MNLLHVRFFVFVLQLHFACASKQRNAFLSIIPFLGSTEYCIVSKTASRSGRIDKSATIQLELHRYRIFIDQFVIAYHSQAASHHSRLALVALRSLGEG